MQPYWRSTGAFVVGAVLTLVTGACDPGPDPPPPPSTTTPTTTFTPPPTLPSPDVSGGGPLGGGDPAAVRRINAQLPDVPEDIQLTGTEAVGYIEKIVAVVPALAPNFKLLSSSVSCLLDYGVVGAKAYLTPDLRAAAAVVIVSGTQAQQLPQIALQCFVGDVPVRLRL